METVVTMAERRVHAVQSLTASIGRIRRLNVEFSQQLEQELGLSIGQVQALDAIAHGARQIGAVAEYGCTHVSSASRVVEQLVREGLVDRAPDPTDRRAVVLSLTADGEVMLERLERLHARLVDDFVGELTDTEVATFAALFERFVDGAEAVVSRR